MLINSTTATALPPRVTQGDNACNDTGRGEQMCEWPLQVKADHKSEQRNFRDILLGHARPF